MRRPPRRAPFRRQRNLLRKTSPNFRSQMPGIRKDLRRRWTVTYKASSQGSEAARLAPRLSIKPNNADRKSTTAWFSKRARRISWPPRPGFLAGSDRISKTPKPLRWRDKKAARNSGKLRPTRRQNRSEEHTSELQSRQYIVCRLLL